MVCEVHYERMLGHQFRRPRSIGWGGNDLELISIAPMAFNGSGAKQCPPADLGATRCEEHALDFRANLLLKLRGHGWARHGTDYLAFSVLQTERPFISHCAVLDLVGTKLSTPGKHRRKDYPQLVVVDLTDVQLLCHHSPFSHADLLLHAAEFGCAIRAVNPMHSARMLLCLLYTSDAAD